MLLRHAVGTVLRDVRAHRKRTLREVAGSAAVSVSYLSEVERGKKEVSSEFLAAICSALDVSVAAVVNQAALELAPAQRRPLAPSEQPRLAA